MGTLKETEYLHFKSVRLLARGFDEFEKIFKQIASVNMKYLSLNNNSRA